MNRLFYAVILLLACFGCSKGDVSEENLDLSHILTNGSEFEITRENVPDWNGLGVFCILSNDEIQHLWINDASGVVKGADAELYCDGSMVGKFIFDDAEGVYKLEFNPHKGKTYNLKINASGKTVEAAASMPPAAERKFTCNPVLVPMVYRNSVFVLEEIGSEYEYAFYSLFDRYPSYSLDTENKRVAVYSYFKDGQGIVDCLYSTHSKSDSYNKTGDIAEFRYLVPVSPEQVAGNKYRVVTDDFQWKYQKYECCRNMVRIQFDPQDSNPYHLASYISVLTSSPELMEKELEYVLEMLKENPQYGCHEKAGEFFGPDFFIMPYKYSASERNDGKEYTQVLMTVSDELDIFFLNNTDHDESEFKAMRSNFTNITGGYGVFGAANIAEYDFSNYHDDMREAYFEIIRTLKEKPPVEYEGFDYSIFW